MVDRRQMIDLSRELEVNPPTLHAINGGASSCLAGGWVSPRALVMHSPPARVQTRCGVSCRLFVAESCTWVFSRHTATHRVKINTPIGALSVVYLLYCLVDISYGTWTGRQRPLCRCRGQFRFNCGCAGRGPALVSASRFCHHVIRMATLLALPVVAC
ncbi:unnamed protein product [Mesocestoides corti]|uniref:Uncharacterized protein n=2 Tax=Mesocestoides corti TaxID=53468 RepID=A0A0R3ULA9_MESCO|nr:unnamed protein product [Mesocestoides corti]